MSRNDLTEIRAFNENPADYEIRNDSDGIPMIRGHFTVFNSRAHIRSLKEGNFTESSRPGAFKRTIDHSWQAFKANGRHAMKVDYNHGFDAAAGQQQLGAIKELREDGTGPYFEIRPLDSALNRDYVLPALRENVLGMSFVFIVPKDGDEWDYSEDVPHRTLTDVKVPSFGPVDYPAYEAAQVGVRTSDTYRMWLNLDDEDRKNFAELIARAMGTPQRLAPAHVDDSLADGTESGDGSSLVGHLSEDRAARVAARINRLNEVLRNGPNQRT